MIVAWLEAPGTETLQRSSGRSEVLYGGHHGFAFKICPIVSHCAWLQGHVLSSTTEGNDTQQARL
jgi:hypothetical protein